MAQIGVFSVISPIESAKYRKGNLLSPPHRSYFALRSHSNTINTRSSTPSATLISPARKQDDVPTILEINKALANTTKSGSILKRGYTPDVVTFNTLLNGLIPQDNADEALSLFNKLLLQDIELNLYTFNIAINCYCRVNRVGFGFSLLGSVFKRGYTPDVVTFNTLLHALIPQDKAEEALSLFNKLLLQDIELDLYTFSIAINCYSCVNRVGFGFSLLGSIFKRGYTPNVIIFNTLLDGLIAQDKADEALSLFNKLLLQDIELDLYTFSIAINCYSRVNRVGFVFSLLGSIFKCGYTPNVVIFNTLLDGLIVQDKADEALSLFNKLLLQDIEIDLYTFNIAINCYCHVNQVGFGFSLLGSIFKRGYTPDVVTFNTLLNALIPQDKADEALSLFNKLLLQDIELDLYTFSIAINCYSRVNRVGFGLSLLGSIFKSGYTPNVVTFSTLLNGFIAQDKAAEALSHFEKLQLQDIELNFVHLQHCN
ncbi:pentatricopeptide repeat-containing protein At1g12300, mitochondrial-like isoform X2 [Rhododendron vialii]|uniref:pentatricopeptide repeat-containing protein At1g12300, mitochondrial-like isoform X2 n=1 Tax=Rhododendron vialii TaxID=182163 RepID=UPI00265F64B8|nr:pentatricopeptide repeat-containing protein At1g12300, mitochondrial-like isoform X2 [Rhododendron vialii]